MFPKISIGSIVKIAHQSREIPAIVLSQNPEDGSLALFCFHFEGQFLQSAWPVVYCKQTRYTDPTGSQQIAVTEEPNVTVLFDAGYVFTDLGKRIAVLEGQCREMDLYLAPPHLGDGMVTPFDAGGKQHGKFKAG